MTLKFTRNVLPPITSMEQLKQLVKEANQEAGLVVFEVDLDPVLANLLLEVNHCNRPVSAASVSALARDIEAGNWNPASGAFIGIDGRGRLVEGQHRCAAVIIADKKVRTLIQFGTDWLNVNTGSHEHGSSKLRGLKYRNHVAALAKMLELEDLGEDGFNRSFKLTAAEVHQYAKDVGGDLVEAASVAMLFARAGMPAHTSFAWAYLRFLDARPREQVVDFFNRLTTGEGMSAPIAALHRRLVADKRAYRGARPATPLTVQEKTFLLFRTFVAHVRGEHLARLQVPHEDREAGVTTQSLVKMLDRIRS